MTRDLRKIAEPEVLATLAQAREGSAVLLSLADHLQHLLDEHIENAERHKPHLKEQNVRAWLHEQAPRDRRVVGFKLQSRRRAALRYRRMHQLLRDADCWHRQIGPPG